MNRPAEALHNLTRRSGSSSQFIDSLQDFPKQVPGHSDFGQLERHVAGRLYVCLLITRNPFTAACIKFSNFGGAANRHGSPEASAGRWDHFLSSFTQGAHAVRMSISSPRVDHLVVGQDEAGRGAVRPLGIGPGAQQRRIVRNQELEIRLCPGAQRAEQNDQGRGA